MLNWLQELFCKDDPFNPGDRVNLAPMGMVSRTDGRVLAHTVQGVLVEWHREGIIWEKPSTLVRILD